MRVFVASLIVLFVVIVGADRIIPIASVAASRDLDASSSTQRAAA
jgi:hypothetical protein